MPIRMDVETPPVVIINPTPRRFLEDFGIRWPQYPSDGLILRHNENAIICEFGQADPINGYQSITEWTLTPISLAQSLVAQALVNSTQTILDITFPSLQWVTRGKLPPVKLTSILQWHALRILTQNHHYKGVDLVRHIWSLVGKPPPEHSTIKSTATKLMSKLRHSIYALI